MRRCWSSWLMSLSLVLCAVLVLGAMAWITRGTMGAERERAEAELRAVIQERTRLALWRMDSFGASVLLEEAAFPEVESRLPVKMRFSVSSQGELAAVDADPKLPELRRNFDGQVLDALCQITQTKPADPQIQELSQWNVNPTGDSPGYNGYAPLDQRGQVVANQNEQAVRSKVVQSTLDNPIWKSRNAAPGVPREEGMKSQTQQVLLPSASGEMPQPAARRDELSDQGQAALANSHDRSRSQENRMGGEAIQDFLMESVVGQPRTGWIDGMLILARRVGNRGTEVFDGAWIDDQQLRELLLAEIEDLLVGASLMPASDPGSDGMVLASFPFRLEVPTPSAAGVPLRSSTVFSLTMSWAAALIALVAILGLVRGVVRLSERRASFVSAVTHELRTPLTTFRLYSDMLERGAVKEERRGEYLGVLSREADRLTHLVENVLAFSRIERGNARSQVQVMDVLDTLEELRDRLEGRLTAAGLHLAIDVPQGLKMKADRVTVEHVLFNLIDNAAKYAAVGDPPVVSITASSQGAATVLRVCDHGPGVPVNEISRIFRPFHKSAREAAESKPGVGLGLALSRRLARQQGGELRCASSPSGACFEFRLPGGRG